MQQPLLSKKFQNFVKITGIAFCAVLTVFIILFGADNILQIRKISIQGYSSLTPFRGLSAYTRKNLLLVSPEDIKKTVLTENPQIRSIFVKKVFPNSLVMSVEIQPFIAVFEMNNGYIYLSENGRIIQKSKEKKEGIPFIRYYQKINYASYSAGDGLEYNDVLTALHFLKALSDLGLQTDTVDINGFDMLLFSVGDKKLFFTTEKEQETQDYELKEIVRQFKIEGRDFKSLDLRFEKPIIKF